MKLLIANRGEIACRVIRACREMKIATVAVYSDADRGALHVREADHSVRIGEAAARDSYLRIDAIVDAVETTLTATDPGRGLVSKALTVALEHEPVVFTLKGLPKVKRREMEAALEDYRKAYGAGKGSIRGDFATTTNENLVHGSDSPESAAREIALFFPGLV